MKKYIKRIGLGLGTLSLIVAGAALFSAFEAHVINVTARIENALSVNTEAIDFGTVFPQEYLTSDVEIVLSDSFVEAGRVDDIKYVIKQKPKVKGSWLCDGIEQPAGGEPANCDPNENPIPGDPYATLTIPGVFTGPAWKYCEDFLPLDAPYGVYNPQHPYWRYCYIPLANYLSKHENTTDGTEVENDKSVDAFHQAYSWNPLPSHLDPQFIAQGRLVKSNGDPDDSWTIDLKVPCFVNQCAQEADDEQNDINDETPGFHVPNEFRLPQALEHLVFGTDLWIEVTEISLPGNYPTPYVTPAPTDGTLTINKVVSPAQDPGKFNLRIDGSTAGTGGDVGNGGTTGAQTFAGGTVHTFDETAGTGTTLSDYTAVISGDADCTDGSVTIIASTNITCIITNTRNTGTITVHKTVVNNDVGTKVAGNFQMQIDGVNVAQDTPIGVPTGAHTISEVNTFGYTTTFSGDCNGTNQVTVGTGENKTCTVTNTAEFFTVTVTKVVNNPNGGNAVIGNFNLFVGSTPMASNVSKKFAPGTYLVSESGVAGYDAIFSGDCDPNTQQLSGVAGDVKSCTITNTDIKPVITLVKNVVGGAATATDFIMRVDGVPVPSGGSKSVTSNGAGHIITEDAKAGYTFTSMTGVGSQGSVCPAALGGSVILNEGEVITCTITNTSS